MTRLYLVDDHVMVRDGLRAVLENAGHEVLGEASDPSSAFAEIQKLKPEVVLLDLSLGQRSGFDLLTELQRRALPIRSIALTMSGQPHDVAEALRLGAAGYLLKGSSRRDLLTAIDTVQQGRRYLGPEVADLAIQAMTGDAGPDPLEALSPRERQIITMVVNGRSSTAIAEQLHLSPKTVDTYRSRLMTKIGVSDVPALVRWAIRARLIDASE